MQDKAKAQLAAALVAALGLAVQSSAQAAPHQGGSLRIFEQSNGLPTSLSEDLSNKKKAKDDKGAESACKGKDGSCKGKEGSCKGKEGACKGKEGACKAKDDSTKGKEGSCKGKEGSCKAK